MLAPNGHGQSFSPPPGLDRPETRARASHPSSRDDLTPRVSSLATRTPRASPPSAFRPRRRAPPGGPAVFSQRSRMRRSVAVLCLVSALALARVDVSISQPTQGTCNATLAIRNCALDPAVAPSGRDQWPAGLISDVSAPIFGQTEEYSLFADHVAFLIHQLFRDADRKEAHVRPPGEPGRVLLPAAVLHVRLGVPRVPRGRERDGARGARCRHRRQRRRRHRVRHGTPQGAEVPVRELLRGRHPANVQGRARGRRERLPIRVAHAASLPRQHHGLVQLHEARRAERILARR